MVNNMYGQRTMNISNFHLLTHPVFRGWRMLCTKPFSRTEFIHVSPRLPNLWKIQIIDEAQEKASRFLAREVRNNLKVNMWCDIREPREHKTSNGIFMLRYFIFSSEIINSTSYEKYCRCHLLVTIFWNTIRRIRQIIFSTSQRSV